MMVCRDCRRPRQGAERECPDCGGTGWRAADLNREQIIANATTEPELREPESQRSTRRARDLQRSVAWCFVFLAALAVGVGVAARVINLLNLW